MGGLLTKIMGGGLLDGVASVISKFKLDPTKAAELEHDIRLLAAEREKAIESTFRSEMEAKARIIVSEMAQGDAFTKRARPMLVYVGLGAIVYNYCVVPTIQLTAGAPDIQPFTLPGEFWAAWGGTVGVWSLGRTMERRGAKDRLTKAITGNALDG
jgi:hypothetical protein